MGSSNRYLRTPAQEKYPVGKVAGTDAHSYNGSHMMHILVEHLEQQGDRTIKEWRLKCAPTKPATYSFMGFRVAITCARCKAGRGVKLDAAD